MAWDSHSNFAKGTLTNSPGTAGTSFILGSGEGALFSANMPVTLVPDNTRPTSTNSEIGYITAVSTDTLTVTRTQQGSTNQNVQAGWLVLGSITAKALTDIETVTDGKVNGPSSATDTGVPVFDGTTGKLIKDSGIKAYVPSANATRITNDNGEMSLSGKQSSGGVNILVNDGTGASGHTVAAAFPAGSTIETYYINGLTLGGVMVEGVGINSGLVDGRDVSVDGTKLDGIESGAQVNTVTPTNTITLSNKTLTTPKIDNIKDSNGNTSINVTATASAVNYVDIVNNATTFSPLIRAAGSDANITLYVSGKGTGSTVIADGSGSKIIEGVSVTSAANNIVASSSAAGTAPYVSVDGSDSNISLNLKSKGSGTVQANGVSVATTTGTQTLTNKTISTGSIIDANATVTEVLKKVYPVGSIYMATVSTNPATLFGFGTWAAYAEGRVIVGKAGAGTFATAGATGGAETHTLTIAEMPTHNHGIVEGSVGGGGNNAYPANNNYGVNAFTENAGGGGAHNNLQPYIVAYIWQRTA